MSLACRKCGRDLAKPRTGRPPRWCSTGCRRAAEYEITRLQRRLQSLEDEREKRRGEKDDGARDWLGRTHAEQARALEEGVREAEERLRALLDAEPETAS